MLNLFSITVVLSRFFAIYMLVTATFSIPTALTLIKQTGVGSRFTSDTVILILTGVVYVLVVVLLFTCAKRFASYVTRGLDNPSIEISENSLTVLQPVAFSILGAYVLTYAFPEVAKLVAFYVHAKTATDTDDLFGERRTIKE